MTGRNVDRSGGYRNELSLSHAVRKIDLVRNMDVDMLQYDPITLQTECWMEATSSQRYTPEEKTRLIRKLALMDNAFSMWILHEDDDRENRYPVKVSVWDNEGTLVIDKETMSWRELQEIWAQLHDEYVLAGLSQAGASCIRKGHNTQVKD
jgi:hypothetical protein